MAKPIVRTQEEIRESRVGLNTCVVCRAEIHIMCRKYTGICSENCDKKRKDRQFAIAA